MDIAGILIAVIAVTVVTFTIVYNIIRAKQGKTSCSCSCPGKSSGTCLGCVERMPADKSNVSEQ